MFVFLVTKKNILQSVESLKNRKIPSFEIAMRNNLSKIIPAQIALDCKIGIWNQTFNLVLRVYLHVRFWSHFTWICSKNGSEESVKSSVIAAYNKTLQWYILMHLYKIVLIYYCLYHALSILYVFAISLFLSLSLSLSVKVAIWTFDLRICYKKLMVVIYECW